MKKKEFLNLFGKRLDKYFNREEINEILEYYSELIDEKVFAGSTESEVISRFDIDEIIKDYTYEFLGKNNITTIKDSYRTVKLAGHRGILIPFLIPVYIVFAILIFVFSIIYFVGTVLMIVPLVAPALPFVEYIFFSHNTTILIANIGYIFLSSGVVIVVGGILFYCSKKVIVVLAKGIKGLRGRKK